MTEARVPVTVEDREVFIYLLGFDAVKDEASFGRIRKGKFDGWEKMQQIARHRLAGVAAGREEGQADVDFLLDRSGHAGSCSFGGKRWTGISSNALVAIAFGRDGQAFPSDSSDLAACYRAVMRLPEHRRTAAVFDHLEKGEAHVESKYGDSIAWAREASEWPGRAALEATAIRQRGE